MSLKIALIQLDPRPGQVAENIARGLDLLADAAAAGAKLAVLPEMWPRSYTDALDLDPAQDFWTTTLQTWQSTCRDHQIACIGGLPHRDGNQHKNRLFFLGGDGRILTIYDKLHMFSYMNEHKRFVPGSAIVTQPFGGLTFGLTICYDLRFPELYRNLRARGADVLITIAQWPTPREEHWDTLLKARAIENLCYSVGVNRSGHIANAEKDHVDFPGHSAVYGPWGETITVLDNREQMIITEIDSTDVQRRREMFPCWQDRQLHLSDQIDAD